MNIFLLAKKESLKVRDDFNTKKIRERAKIFERERGRYFFYEGINESGVGASDNNVIDVDKEIYEIMRVA